MTDFNKTHDISIQTTSPGWAEIRMDGENISRAVQGYIVSQNAGETPQVVLRLKMYELRDESKAYVTIPEETRTLLRALGWTPPEGREDGGNSGRSIGSPKKG